MTRLDVVLPIETIVRELDARLLFATAIARRDRRILLVEAEMSHQLLPRLRDGVYVGKQAFHPEPSADGPLRYHRQKRQSGFRFLHLSEEGAVFTGVEADWNRYLDLEIDPRHLAPDDYLCTWGRYQHAYYQARAPERAAQIRVTGHPRFDLYTPRWRELFRADAEEHRRRHGRFVLINTNFSLGINPLGPRYSFSPALGYDGRDPERRSWVMGLFSRAHRTAALYAELATRVSVQHPDVTVVVRPHPSEDLSWYESVFRDAPNIVVSRQGGVASWILGSSCVVHDGCTTGLEAHLLGTPVITYSPVAEDEHLPYLTTLVGRRCRTEAEAFEAIEAALAGSLAESHATFPERARGLLENLQQESIPRLAAVFEEAAEGRRPSSTMSDRGILAMQAALDGQEALKNIGRRFSPLRMKGVAERKGRFPGWNEAHIMRRVRQMADISGKPLHVRVFGGRAIEITSD